MEGMSPRILPPAVFQSMGRGAAAGLFAAAAIVLASCQSAPDRTIPDPLPETLEWALPELDRSAFLGLEVRENDSGSLESLSFDPGVRVHAVTDRSPAAAAGIRVDDVLLSFDGTPMAAPEDLSSILSMAKGGDDVKLQLQRGDAVFDVSATLSGGAAESEAAVAEAFVLDPARTRGAWGTNDGAVLVSRAEDGPVGRLPIGTRVTGLDGTRIVSGRGLVRRLIALDPGTSVELTYRVPNATKDKTGDVKLQDEGRRTTRFSVPVLATYDAAPDRSTESFVLLDLYLISLFRYERVGSEKNWRFLRFFHWSSGIGELEE